MWQHEPTLEREVPDLREEETKVKGILDRRNSEAKA